MDLLIQFVAVVCMRQFCVVMSANNCCNCVFFSRSWTFFYSRCPMRSSVSETKRRFFEPIALLV